MYKFLYKVTIFLSVAISALILIPAKVFAQQQEINKKFLLQYSKILKTTADENRNRALSMAKEKGWTVFKVKKNGAVISLQGIDELGLPIYFRTDNNSTSAITTRTNKLYSGGGLGLNLSGLGDNLINKVGLWDGGSVYTAHREFAGGRINNRNSGAEIIEHSTHVAGTMMAAGIYPAAKGMAYGLKKLSTYDFNSDISEMASEASAGMLISNHSYGSIAGWEFNDSPSSGSARWEYWGLPGSFEDYKFGIYNSSASVWDQVCFNAPFYLPVKSAGNNRNETGPAVGGSYYRLNSSNTMVDAGMRPEGISSNDSYGIISTYGNAKNILVVGAAEGLPNGYTNPASVKIASFSSFGPTDDGRIKPDIVGAGINVTSTGNTGPDSYFSASGTSMAAPNVSGSLVLLQEQYSQKNNGNFMRSATLKGLVIHTADEAGDNPGPDYRFGWGLLNMEKASLAISNNGTKSLISERQLAQGETQTIPLVASGNGPLIATICWTDPEGSATATGTLNDPAIKLINDLDIQITSGSELFKPWILDPNNPAAAASKGDNIRDNVEQVFIENAVPGRSYSLSITHKGSISRGPQKFSLLVTGTGGTNYCTSAPASNTDSRIVNFKLGSIDNTPNTDCKTYSDFTSMTTSLEAGKTYPLSIILGTCAADFDKIAKVFIDYNANGLFEINELAATSNVINATGDYSTTITIPPTIIPDNYSILRVVLTETNDAANVTACGFYSKGETQDYRVKFVKAGTDAGVVSIVDPAGGSCKNTSQKLTVKLKNYGTKAISNVPLTATITNGTAIITLSQAFAGILDTSAETDFTFSTPFSTQPGVSYTITASANLTGDLNPSNNSAHADVSISNPPVISSGTALYCSGSAAYLLTANGDGTVFWYNTATDMMPLAYNSPAQVAAPSGTTTFYAGLNDFSGKVGPKTKMQFSGGGYNQFSPDVLVNTKVPVILDSARLYIGNSGKITFTVNKASSGVEVSKVTLDVIATDPTPQTGASLDNDPLDKGQVYPLNLLLPEAGDYSISISYENGATIFRNNGGVSGYPFRIGNIFSITGNTATTSETTTFADFYYCFYDLKVKSAGCANELRFPVIVDKPVITITQTENLLNSSFATGNQWYLNNVSIPLATGASYKPLKSGVYRVESFTTSGCSVRSDDLGYISSVNPSDKPGPTLYPVPSAGGLNISFPVLQNESIKIQIANLLGKPVYTSETNNFSGDFLETINLSNQANGIYYMKIEVGNTVYRRRIFLNK